MLNKEIFKEELKKLAVEYGDKGFTMNADRVNQWYDYMKNMQDQEYKEKVDYVIKNSTYAPCMADILKAPSETKTKKGLLGWD